MTTTPKSGPGASDPKSTSQPSDGSQASTESPPLTAFQASMMAMSRGPMLPIDLQPINPALLAGASRQGPVEGPTPVARENSSKAGASLPPMTEREAQDRVSALAARLRAEQAAAAQPEEPDDPTEFNTQHRFLVPPAKPSK